MNLSAHYDRPDLADVRAHSLELAETCRRADREARFVETVRAWNRLRIEVDTQQNLAMVAYHRDTRDAGARAEHGFWDRAAPLLRELDALFARTVVESAHAGALASRFGDHFLALSRCRLSTFDPAIADDLATEAELTTRYTELLAQPEVAFRGERISLSGLASHYGSADRATRLEAQLARDTFLSERAGELDDLFDRLVGVRHRMAVSLGHDSFVPLGYQLLGRPDYGPDEVARFRAAILDEVVPLATDLMARRAAALGVDELRFHDEPCMDLAGNPRPIGDVRTLVGQARTVYRELGDDLGDFLDLMADRGLLDLEARPGKAGGGFCTTFAGLGVPFVFANCNGSDDDVRVFTHECGHAFQMYASRHHELLEYRIPGYEAAEVHSMSMEWLVHPWMDRFFSAGDAERFRRLHLESRVATLPYMAAVDEFQHEIYQRPSLSPAERKALWLEVERRYLPWRDYGELPYLASGGLWQRQAHVYRAPFYYIDYALAETCAMQLWQRAEGDRAAAMADYRTMCELGGSVGFAEMLRRGRLALPFDAGCLAGVMGAARAALGL